MEAVYLISHRSKKEDDTQNENEDDQKKLKKKLYTKPTNEMDSSNTQSRNFLKLRPTKEELKEIFENIVQELKNEIGF